MTATTTSTSEAGPRTRFEPHRRPHPLRRVGELLILAVCAGIAYLLVTSPNLDWAAVAHYQFAHEVLKGLVVTVELTVICMALGIVLGAFVAAMGMSQSKVIRSAAWAYLFFFRGTPILVQLVFWFNLAAILPHVSLPIPFSGQTLTFDVNVLISGFTAAVLGLALHEAAMMAEVIRGGVQGIDRGQVEASQTLGLRHRQYATHILLPQVIRLILPVTANRLITLLKSTAMVAFIAGGDLLTQVSAIYARNFKVIPLLIVATIWYLVCVAIASVFQRLLEKRFGRGANARTLGMAES